MWLFSYISKTFKEENIIEIKSLKAWVSISQFSRSVISNSLRPHGLQHCQASLSITNFPNSCPSSRWCHPTISSSVVPFSSCLQSSPASGSFPMTQFFTSGDQSIGSSASAISPSNEYSGLISVRTDSLQSKGLWRVFSNITFKSINSSVLSFLYSPSLTSTHDYWKNHGFHKMDFCWESNVSAFLYAM